MKLAINAAHFINAAVWEEERSTEEALFLVKEAGFRHLDLAVEEKEDVEKIAVFLERNGMDIVQTHVPFKRNEEESEEAFRCRCTRVAENAATLGSPILVVHGDEFPADTEYSPEAAMAYNIRYFCPLVEFAAKKGMKVAFENLFETEKVPNRFCSRMEEALALCDRFGSETAGICFDLGHAKVQYKKEYLSPLRMAEKKVICTHIHDNFYGKDLHTFPFMGNADWPAFMQTLREIGYEGAFSLELAKGDRIPRKFASEYVSLLYRSAEYITKEL